MSASSERRSTAASSPVRSRAARASSPGSFVATPSAMPRRPFSARVQPTDRPEVEQPDRALRVDEHVARVRIGVEQPVVQDLTDVGREHAARQLGTRDRGLVERLGLAHGPAEDLLHDEDAVGREGRVHAGDRDPDVAGAVLAQRRPDLGLVQELELLLEAADELLREPAQADRPRGLDAALQAAREHAQDRRVACDDVLDAGPADLDDDARAVVQHGPVRLADRRRRERLPLERRERLIDRFVELGLDHDAHVAGRDGSHVRAQLGQLGGQRRREHVVARRGDLPELDHHPARVLEHRSDAAGEVG
jgi:hypothetical protein